MELQIHYVGRHLNRDDSLSLSIYLSHSHSFPLSPSADLVDRLWEALQHPSCLLAGTDLAIATQRIVQATVDTHTHSHTHTHTHIHSVRLTSLSLSSFLHAVNLQDLT